MKFIKIPFSLIDRLYKKLINIDEIAVSKTFYNEGYELGRDFVKNKNNNLDLVLKDLVDKIKEWGWGICFYEVCEDDGRVTFELDNYLKDKEESFSNSGPDCHFLRGLFTGVIENVLNKKCISIENRCISQGDNKCRFIIESLE